MVCLQVDVLLGISNKEDHIREIELYVGEEISRLDIVLPS